MFKGSVRLNLQFHSLKLTLILFSICLYRGHGHFFHLCGLWSFVIGLRLEDKTLLSAFWHQQANPTLLPMQPWRWSWQPWLHFCSGTHTHTHTHTHFKMKKFVTRVYKPVLVLFFLHLSCFITPWPLFGWCVSAYCRFPVTFLSC